MNDFEYRQALKTLPREVRIVILHLEEEIQNLHNLNVQLSEEAQTKAVTDRVLAIIRPMFDSEKKAVQTILQRIANDKEVSDRLLEMSDDILTQTALRAKETVMLRTLVLEAVTPFMQRAADTDLAFRDDVKKFMRTMLENAEVGKGLRTYAERVLKEQGDGARD